MIKIAKANANIANELSRLAATTFIQSHGASASAEDIQHYVSDKLNVFDLGKALTDPVNHYSLLYDDDHLIGFSNIIFNRAIHPADPVNHSKLERLYLLKELYNTGAGKSLLQYNVELAKQQHQQAIWLNVWTENERALNFYIRNGFAIIGTTDFFISPTHSNPNYFMQLKLT